MAIATPRDRSYTKNQIGTIKELHNNYAMVMFDGVLTKVDYLDTEEVDENNRILYRIKYFPLIPAYAFTCHRAQGMTLKELTVDCENIFEDGQMYVALSRAVHPDGLTILH
jgi:ATP-dependent exoDNAse (exonuclease V) alpha subunit